MEEEIKENREVNETLTKQAPNTSTLIDNATDAANALKTENDRKEALLAKEEEMLARKELGGQSEGGIVKEVVSPEEVKKKQALDYFAGSEIEDALKKYG